MDSKRLKSIQYPIKEKYREQPDAAIVTLKAQGKIGDGITCKVDTGRAIAEAGLHPATGGSGIHACSGDMLLEALVACAGVTLNAVSTSIGVDIKDSTVIAEGDLDFRGTLGVSKEATVGFKAIRLSFTIESNATDEQIQTLEKLTERYCVVYQTLVKGVQIETTLNKK